MHGKESIEVPYGLQLISFFTSIYFSFNGRISWFFVLQGPFIRQGFAKKADSLKEWDHGWPTFDAHQGKYRKHSSAIASATALLR